MKKLYAAAQACAEEPYPGLPSTLDGLGPVLRVDFANNEGEDRIGLVRVFLGVKGSDKTLLELLFRPLLGTVGWMFYGPSGDMSGTSEFPLLKFVYPERVPMQIAMLYAVELLDAGNDEHRLAAREILHFMRDAPNGHGYRRFAREMAPRLLAIADHSSTLSMSALREGEWYGYELPNFNNEDAPLEIVVGQAALLEDRVALNAAVLVTIAEKGRGPARVQSTDAPSLNAAHFSDPFSKIFAVPASLAQSLPQFVTPKLPSSLVIARYLRGEAAAPAQA